MTVESRTGTSLEAAKRLAENRDTRANQLKSEGRRVMGYFCSYMPLEILTAAKLIPYRIQGSVREPVTDANVYLDPGICPYLKSCYDMVLKGKYDFLDGWVTADSCDSRICLYKVWRYNLKPTYSYWLNVPNFLDEECFRFFREELAFFKKSIEGFTQSKISNEKLYEAIDLHNELRALLRELYELRKLEPPLFYGSEALQILLAVTSLPVEEANELLRGIIAEVKERNDGPEKSRARLLLYGPEVDDPALLKVIEDCGGNVVIDDACVGTRFFWHDAEKTDDPLDGLVNRCLGKNMCPRTIRGRMEGRSTYEGDLEERFGHIRDFARDYNVSGVILCIMKFCDLHEYDVP
ncbi:2-hydroxyacyl-CoA dehydratase subunit D, partial [Chloroflexota bacterium]